MRHADHEDAIRDRSAELRRYGLGLQTVSGGIFDVRAAEVAFDAFGFTADDGHVFLGRSSKLCLASSWNLAADDVLEVNLADAPRARPDPPLAQYSVGTVAQIWIGADTQPPCACGRDEHEFHVTDRHFCVAQYAHCDACPESKAQRQNPKRFFGVGA